MENSEYIGRHVARDENGEPIMKEGEEGYEAKHAAENPWDDLAENPPIFAGDAQGAELPPAEEESAEKTALEDETLSEDEGDESIAAPTEAETRRAQIDELAQSLDGAAALEFKQETSAQTDGMEEKIEGTASEEDKSEEANESPFGVPLPGKEPNPEATESESEEETTEKTDEEPEVEETEKEKSEGFLGQKEIDGIIDNLQDMNRQLSQIDSIIAGSKSLEADLDDLNHVRVRMIHDSEAAIDDLRQARGVSDAQEEYVRRMSRSCAEAVEICRSMSGKATRFEGEDAEYAISKLRDISNQVEQIQGYLVSKMRNR